LLSQHGIGSLPVERHLGTAIVRSSRKSRAIAISGREGRSPGIISLKIPDPYATGLYLERIRSR
jgi:hypothetical protein